DANSAQKASDASANSAASVEPAAAQAVPPPKLDEFAQVPDTSVRAKTIGASVTSQEGTPVPKGDEHLAAELRATRNAAHAHEHHAGGRILGSSEEHVHSHAEAHGEAHGRGGGGAVAQLDDDKLAYDTDRSNGGRLNPRLPAEHRTADAIAPTH